MQRQLDNETAVYGDVVQLPMVDTYETLAHKLKLAFKWALEHTDARWLLKSDDDSFVRVNVAMAALAPLQPNMTVVGFIRCETTVPRIGKNADWYLLPEQSQARTRRLLPARYPPFANGASGYAISRDVAALVVRLDGEEFGGEDTSLGIWLERHRQQTGVAVSFLYTRAAFAQTAFCEDPDVAVMGHNMSPQRIRSCPASGRLLRKHVIGGLGNQLFQFDSSFGIANANRAKLCITEQTNKAWLAVWRNLTRYFVGPFPPLCQQKVGRPHASRITEPGFARYAPIRLENGINDLGDSYLQAHRYFNTNEIARLLKTSLTLRSGIRSTARRLRTFASERVRMRSGLLAPGAGVASEAMKTVGLHVQHRDLLNYTHIRFPPAAYFKKAMAHFDAPGVVFLVVTDSPTWCQLQPMFRDRPNVYILHEDDLLRRLDKEPWPMLSLAILATCDAVILSVGTFGWWGAWLSGRPTVYFADEFRHVALGFLPRCCAAGILPAALDRPWIQWARRAAARARRPSRLCSAVHIDRPCRRWHPHNRPKRQPRLLAQNAGIDEAAWISHGLCLRDARQ